MWYIYRIKCLISCVRVCLSFANHLRWLINPTFALKSLLQLIWDAGGWNRQGGGALEIFFLFWRLFVVPYSFLFKIRHSGFAGERLVKYYNAWENHSSCLCNVSLLSRLSACLWLARHRPIFFACVSVWIDSLRAASKHEIMFHD